MEIKHIENINPINKGDRDLFYWSIDDNLDQEVQKRFLIHVVCAIMADDKHAKRMFYDWCLLPFIWTYTQDLKLCKTQIKVYEPSNDKKHVGLPHELLELKPRRFSEQPTAMRENNCVEPNKVFWCFLEKKGMLQGFSYGGSLLPLNIYQLSFIDGVRKD